MKRPCKICWLILSLFLIANFVLIGVWWFDNDQPEKQKDKAYSSEGRRERMREHMREQAGVDDAQFEEMYQLWELHGKDMKGFDDEMNQFRHSLMQESFSISADSVKVNSLLDSIMILQRKIDDANYKHFRSLRDICKSDEQREMLGKMFRSFGDKNGRHSRGKGRRRGKE